MAQDSWWCLKTVPFDLFWAALLALQVEVDEASLVETVEVNESQSYPGLRSKVRRPCGGGSSSHHPHLSTAERQLCALCCAVCVQAGECTRAWPA
jgi:hypothetical protein